jgi:predicted enzyme related to lactoylglutathione lyase
MNIRHLALVSIPVSDQERALAFYRDALGFRVEADAPFGEGRRWIQLEPGTDAATGIALVDWFDAMPPGGVVGLILRTDDIEADRAKLLERGVEVDEIQETPWGRFAGFNDPDGNGWSLQER